MSKPLIYAGRYEIIKVLHECGSFKVTLVKDIRTQKRLSIKIPKPFFQPKRR